MQAPSDETAGVSVLTIKPRCIGQTISNSNRLAGPADLILRGLELYLQEFVSATVRNELMALGLTARKEQVESPMRLNLEARRALRDVGSQEPPATIGDDSTKQGASGKRLIAEAIESYLKDVEPPQRERKTFDEYKLVLYRFRDTCGKRFLEDLGRDDCLSFIRHLYSNGNEARTVFNCIWHRRTMAQTAGYRGSSEGP